MTRLLAPIRLAVLDVAAPILVYALLRGHGWSAVTALVASGAAPALNVAATWLSRRRLEVIGALVIVGVVSGAVIGLVSGDPRLVLAEDSAMTGAFGLVCLGSLRSERPLMFRLARQFMGEDSRRGRDFADRWQHPGFRHAFRVITAVWGVAYVSEAAARIVIVETLSTGTALAVSKTMPYVVAAGLVAWMMAYGRWAQKRAGGRRSPSAPGVVARIATDALTTARP